MAVDSSPGKLSRQSFTVSASLFKSQTATLPSDISDQMAKGLALRSLKVSSQVCPYSLKKQGLPVATHLQSLQLPHNKLKQLDLQQVCADLETVLKALQDSSGLPQNVIQGEDGYYHHFDADKYAKPLELLKRLLDHEQPISVAQQTQLSQAALRLQPVLRQLAIQTVLKHLPSVMDDVSNHVNRAITLKVKTSLQTIGLSPYRTSMLPSTEQHTITDFQSSSGKAGLINQACYPEAIQTGSTLNLFVHNTLVANSQAENWLQPNSLQAQLISERFGGKTTGFRWSGTGQRARQEAAERLAELLKQYCEKQVRINLFAHGHGGSVVKRTLQKLNQLNKQHSDAVTALYQINFLALLGSPVRYEGALPYETVKALTRYYVNVVPGRDSVTASDDAHFARSGRGAGRLDKAAHEWASRLVDRNADFVLTLIDADHDQLHDFVVFNQLRDPNLS